MIYFLIFFLIMAAAYFAFTRTGSKLSPNIDAFIKEVLAEPLPRLINGQTGEASGNGVSIYYESINQQENLQQEVVLLINGHTQTMLDWPQEFIEALSAAGHRVVRFDNRGIGMSDWIPTWNAKSNAYVLEDLAKDALSVLDHLGIEKAHVVGQSMGGMIGQRLAISHGKRLKSLTSIMSTAHYHDPELVNIPKGFYKEFIRLTFRYMFGLKALANKLKLHLEVRYALDGAGDYNVNEKQVLRKARYEIEKRRGYNMKATDQHSHAIKESPSRYEGLKKLSIPVLVVHGTTDPLVTFEHAKKYAPMIPKAKTLFIEGMGHDLPSKHIPEITTGIKELIKRAK